MSGITGSKLNIRGSGLVAKLGTDGQVLTSAGVGVQAAFEDLSGGIEWQSVTTGSTLTAVAGNGYPIDTTSNACAVTLPGSASVGDQIIFTDYARTWETNNVTLDPNGLNYQGYTYDMSQATSGQSVHIVYMDATNGWIPILDAATSVAEGPSATSNGIFAYGYIENAPSALSNIVSSGGVVASDVAGVGTARRFATGCEYGNDKGIIAYGHDSYYSMSNLVSNLGVVSSDVSGVGTARRFQASATYGGDKGIFAFGQIEAGAISLSNLVNSSGVIGADVTGVGTARQSLAACEFSANKDKAIFAFGETGSGDVSTSNLVSNAGVVATDTTGVGTACEQLSACDFGGDKGIFAYGRTSGPGNLSNLVSNSGVVATDTTGVGTARYGTAACEYGGDKGIFGFGETGVNAKLGMTNLVTNAGVIGTDVSAVGTVRTNPAGCSFA